MTLNQMSAMYNDQTQQALGFQLKSKQTGRVFTAVYKYSGDQYVIAPVGGGKASLVEANSDRYEFADTRFDQSAGKKQELSAKLSELINKEGALNARIEDLQEQINTLEETELEPLHLEMETLEQQLDEMD
jgi:hypothetical protein